MLAEFGIEDHRQQARASPGPGDGMERCRRLSDFLARPASEFLAHRLDHLPLARYHLQGLGNVLAEFGQPAAADRTDTGSRNDDPLARQMAGKGARTGRRRVKLVTAVTAAFS